MIRNEAYKKEQAQERDRKTIEAIGGIYCKAHHGKEAQKATTARAKLCPQCAEVVEYAMARTKRCPNNHEGNCVECEIHCFNGSMRKKVRAMMAYAAPRMLARHPIMTIRYLQKKSKQA